jgi:5-deoxy-glucuronate isomerase
MPETIFRNTNSHKGRGVCVSPANSPMQHLAYARIILDREVSSASFRAPGRETGLIVLSGKAAVTVDGQTTELGEYDAVYIPRDASVEITSEGADIAEFSAEVSERHPMQVVRYLDAAKDGSLRFTAGTAAQQRVVTVLIGKNVQANRLLAGFTVSDPGNWTSWPPHEHAEMLEEIYVYFDMPHPAFGIQLLYNDTQYPETITAVRDGDAVAIPSGYHPNVAVPGHRITFLWALAAHREKEDRVYGVVNVQPEFRPAPAR